MDFGSSCPGTVDPGIVTRMRGGAAQLADIRNYHRSPGSFLGANGGQIKENGLSEACMKDAILRIMLLDADRSSWNRATCVLAACSLHLSWGVRRAGLLAGGNLGSSCHHAQAPLVTDPLPLRALQSLLKCGPCGVLAPWKDYHALIPGTDCTWMHPWSCQVTSIYHVVLLKQPYFTKGICPFINSDWHSNVSAHGWSLEAFSLASSPFAGFLFSS